ncbi:MAG: gamma-glutamyltransferase [Gemmatimonadota bacterium]
MTALRHRQHVNRGVARRSKPFLPGVGSGLVTFAALLTGGCATATETAPPAPAAPAPVAVAAGWTESGQTGLTIPSTWRYQAGRAPVLGRRGMVVSTDSLASAAGLSVLKAGGNAVDAAIAVQFALAVVQPSAGNIGGGGFIVARLADDTRFALDFRERAPGAATRDMFLDSAGNVTDASLVGHRAAGVPGSVAGMHAAWERYGSLPWATLLDPAIRLARGFEVAGQHARSLAFYQDKLLLFPASAAVFLPGGSAPQVGDTLRQPDLARSLSAIAEDGPAAFYTGWIADSLVAEMERGGGIISHRDLAEYEPAWRTPVEVEYRGYRVLSMPPSSSGGITLGELLNIAEGFDLGSLEWHSADAIHLAVEAMRRAFADRNYYLGDSDFVDVPADMLLSQSYADSLRASIDPNRASLSADFNKVPLESTQTTHFSIVDSAGNAVAVTTTLNGGYGSKVVVRGAGFALNNEMDDFTSKPGVPNVYGLVQGTANAIEPGKRMLSAMTPTIVIAPDGRTELLTGTPGGATIISTIFQIVTNHIDFGLSPTESVDSPRFHHQNLPDVIRYERGGLSDELVRELRSRGHNLRERTGISGDVMTIHVRPDGTLVGAADRRRDGKALGY